FFFSGASRRFSGSDFVMVSKAETERWRWPGVLGLSLRIAMISGVRAYVPSRGAGGFAPGVQSSLDALEEVDLAGGQRDDGLLVARLPARHDAAAGELAAALAAHHHRPDLLDLDAGVALLDGLADLDLVGVL